MASPLIQKINSDLVTALKKRESLKTETLRLLLSSVHNKEIEKRGLSAQAGKGNEAALNDEEVLEVINKEAKKRKEATELFIKGGRKDLADKETAELQILKDYLPAELGESEVLKIIEEVVRLKPGGPQDFGRIMGEVMKQLKGRADASIVSRLVKERLESR